MKQNWTHNYIAKLTVFHSVGISVVSANSKHVHPNIYKLVERSCSFIKLCSFSAPEFDFLSHESSG